MLFSISRDRRANLSQSGPPKELMLMLRREFGLRDFVETGTFEGRTAVWAAGHFERVVTIENAKTIYERTSAQHAHVKNVRFVFGHSRDAIGGVVEGLTGPALFWLDGHWSGGETYGSGDECPVLDEIRTIDASHEDHFLLIDDARLFVAPPPRPHDAAAWPSIDDVVGALKARHPDAYVVIMDDVIVRVPKRAKKALIDFCQAVATDAWRAEVAAKAAPTNRDALRLIAEGVRLLGENVRKWAKPSSSRSGPTS
jgi:hypothetical protein